MATYFHGNPAEFQAPDGLQTLVLMNPTTYLQQQQQHQQQFSDSSAPAPTAHHHNNLIFLNSHHAPPPPQPPPHSSHHQHFLGIPTTTTDDSISALHGLVPRVHYNMYNPNYPSTPARDAPRAKQGLSLSLSSQQQHPGFGFQAISGGDDIRVSGGSASSGSGVTNGVSGMQSVLLSSKYLKAAQELLDEVVNVNNHNSKKSEFSKKGSSVNHDNSGSSNKVTGESSAAAGDDDKAAAGKRAAELTTAERQEIQMKKAKLINMLDEVEQRYRQYHHQMQIVIQSFEQAAGIGTAKTYTALALKTISKQFRCLKDAITGQIKAANKMLGEEDCAGGGKIEGSRLKFVDNHLRQQRALQQLGMIQHNAWRPQRGLPERSVSVLRAWLFEHFLHPYPKDSDKQLLAKQTGLTRSQVSNWFINARVRLWKPMVEEMYLEELKEQEQNGSEDRTSKSEQNEDSAPKSAAPSLQEKNLVNETHRNARSFKSSTKNIDFANPSVHSVMSLSGNGRNQQSGFSLIGSSELEGLTQGSPKKTRASNNDMNMMLSPANVPSSISMDVKPDGGAHHNDQISMKFDDDSQSARDGYSFMGNQMNFIQGFGQYPMGEIGRFDAEQFTTTPSFSSGNGVSLTLGLPHCENLSLSATHHQPFLPSQSIQLGRRVEIVEPNEYGAINTQSPHSSAAYESLNIQNRKRFAAQLLPDFVA